MLVRLLAAGVASLVVIALSGVSFYLFARPARTQPVWLVTKATSALHTMVIDIDTVDLSRAREIGDEVIAPLRSREYDEVLIYIHPAGRQDSTTPIRRLQWTPHGGFVESDY